LVENEEDEKEKLSLLRKPNPSRYRFASLQGQLNRARETDKDEPGFYALVVLVGRNVVALSPNFC
jgi:hypothetical protein